MVGSINNSKQPIISRQIITGSGQLSARITGNNARSGDSNQEAIRRWASPIISLPVGMKPTETTEPLANIVTRSLNDSPRGIGQQLVDYVNELFGFMKKAQSTQAPLDSVDLKEKVSSIMQGSSIEGLELARQAGVFNERPYQGTGEIERMSSNPASRLHQRGEFLFKLYPVGGDTHLYPNSSLQIQGLDGKFIDQACKKLNIRLEDRLDLPEEEYKKVLQVAAEIQLGQFSDMVVSKANEMPNDSYKPTLLQHELIRTLNGRELPTFLIAQAREADNWIQLEFRHSRDEIDLSGGEFAKGLTARDRREVQRAEQYFVSATSPIFPVVLDSTEEAKPVRFEATIPSEEIHKYTFPEFS